MADPPVSPAAEAPDPVRLEFADGQVACVIIPDGTTPPDMTLSILPLAMRTLLEELGPPPDAAELTIRLQPPPSFAKRALSLFRVDALATQQDDGILLRPGTDPLKLAFRLGHELSHWIVYRQHPARPPLWLDEGLANTMGAAAAETAGRTLNQSVNRPIPDKLPGHLYSLEDLLELRDYPKRPAEVAAFYWQAEALVTALRAKLGREAFNEYLGLMATSAPPAWDTPLRERWYFNDADFRWFAAQIRPETRQAPAP